jgi:crotonobetaine/carnitine-CoA ligase
MTLDGQIDTSLIQSMAGLDVPWLLRQWSERTPDKPFLIWEPFNGDSRSWSYRAFHQQVRQFASGLHGRGVRAGDFVLVHLDNSPEFVLAWYACAELGAVAVSTNTRSVARDLAYFADHTSAVCAITQPRFAALVSESCPNLNFIAVTDDDAGDPPDPLPEGAFVAFATLQDDPALLPPLATEPLRDLGVQFTSGTTSRPKAVMWTHANAIWAGRVSAAHMRIRHDDVCLTFLPLFHTNAQAYSMLATHWSGGTLVLQQRFSASRFWDVSKRHRVTWCSTIPFAIKALERQKVPRHHYRFWGTAAYLPDVGRHFGIDVMGWWGMTETLTHGIVTDPDHPGPAGTIGRAAPEYQIQIRHDDGNAVAPGEVGKLFIRGVRGISLFKEYYGYPPANDNAFDEHGWFDTGDNVRLDECGWVFFTDRSKDMLKVGAENVAASEVESVIMQTGLVEECAVVAQSHYMLDEVPVAFVIPAADAPASIREDIVRHCRANLADFKVVRAVHVVETLPRSTLEKVAKNELRARLAPITE